MREGDTWHVQCSLAQTAAWLLRQPRTDVAATEEYDPTPYFVDMARNEDVITLVTPPGTLDGRPLEWPSAPARLGSSPPRWRGALPTPTWAGSG
jgi:hypothetical protein